MVEVIVALAILGISLAAIFGALRNCAAAAHHARMLTGAALVGENLLAETILAGGAAFETKQGQQGPYYWQVRIGPAGGSGGGVENLGAVYVQVSWQEWQRVQSYEVTSLFTMSRAVEGK